MQMTYDTVTLTYATRGSQEKKKKSMCDGLTELK